MCGFACSDHQAFQNCHSWANDRERFEMIGSVGEEDQGAIMFQGAFGEPGRQRIEILGGR